MNNSGASSSDPKGKRPMNQEDLDDLERISRENKRIKRILEEATMLGIPFEEYKMMVEDDEHLLEKQSTEDEKLANILSQFLEEEETSVRNRQIKEDEEFAKTLAKEEENNSPKRERSILAMSSDAKENVLLGRKRNIASGSILSESDSD